MKNITLAFTALAAISLMSLVTTSADAAGFGFRISSGYYPTYYTASPIYYNSGYGGIYYDDHVHHGDVWHDTSHYHYRPARIIHHGDHFHYEPGRYELHRTGHWDHYHW
jgi:hypothetical protein